MGGRGRGEERDRPALKDCLWIVNITGEMDRSLQLTNSDSDGYARRDAGQGGICKVRGE